MRDEGYEEDEETNGDEERDSDEETDGCEEGDSDEERDGCKERRFGSYGMSDLGKKNGRVISLI